VVRFPPPAPSSQSIGWAGCPPELHGERNASTFLWHIAELDSCPQPRFVAVQSAQSRPTTRRRMARSASRCTRAPAPPTRESVPSAEPQGGPASGGVPTRHVWVILVSGMRHVCMAQSSMRSREYLFRDHKHCRQQMVLRQFRPNGGYPDCHLGPAAREIS
jgi:hypothetical protein